MYFITKRESGTGLKFQEIENKMLLIKKAQKKIGKELGFTQYRQGYWKACGGFSAILFDNDPNQKIWKNVNGSKKEWMPKLNTKAGKELQKLLDSAPVIGIHELNMCIGFKGAPFNTIGFATNNDKYFGFSIGNGWGVNIPSDCEEVTYTKYKELFKLTEEK